MTNTDDAAYDYRTQRLFVETSLKAGAKIDLDRGQSNYLLNVLRLKEGAGILVFNGHDGEWRAKIEPTGRKSCRLAVTAQTRPQPEPLQLEYAFAPLKQARLDYMVQKAVEMGAGRLQPVVTQHTQVNRLNVDRMRANAIEAAEQCGILTIPECNEPQKLDKFLEQWDETVILVFCDEATDNKTAVETLRELEKAPAGILVGPEGGFSPQERELLRSLDHVVAISLGPRILRADTAAVAGLSVVQAVCGDWR